MSQTIEISEQTAALLREQAAARGISLEAWLHRLATEKALPPDSARQEKIRAAVEGILELQKHVKPDPEGWTIRDYVSHGRR